jgi:hypothetical protein
VSHQDPHDLEVGAKRIVTLVVYTEYGAMEEWYDAVDVVEHPIHSLHRRTFTHFLFTD